MGSLRSSLFQYRRGKRLSLDGTVRGIQPNRYRPGPDSAFSLEPDEFQEMVEAVRVAHRALGAVRYGAGKHETPARRLRRSLFVVKDVKAGEPLTVNNVRSIRPAGGLHTRYLDQILGRPARCDIPRGTPLGWGHVG